MFTSRPILPREGSAVGPARQQHVFSKPVVEIIDEEAGTLTLMFEDTVRGAVQMADSR